jgi:hypothetical protein
MEIREIAAVVILAAVIVGVAIMAEPSAPLYSPEGNEGAFCFSSNRCTLPGSYAIRSTCPFAMRCINNECRVVCPQWGANCTFDAQCDCKRFYSTGTCRCIEGECAAVMDKSR